MTVTFEAPTRNQREMERERELVAAACAGDPAAFAVLVRSHRPRVTAVVARMVGSVDAEDVVQEALLRAYLSLSRLRRADRFGPWLCGIAINLAKMRLRWRAAQPILVVGGEALGATEERDLLRVVQDAVELLPPGQRDVVLLHYVDDLSCDEVARLLGTSPGAVRVRLHRARAQLRPRARTARPRSDRADEEGGPNGGGQG